MRKRNQQILLAILMSCMVCFAALDSYAQPANDLCSAVTPTSFAFTWANCNQSFVGTTIGATQTYSNFCAITSDAPDVWYGILGTGGFITIRLIPSNGVPCQFFPGWDTKLHVFRGSCTGLICVTANDDACLLWSEVTWNSSFNTIYFIKVSGVSGSTGTFRIEAENGHTNINCANAITVTAGTATAKGSTRCSSYSGQAACSPAPASSAPDHWYRYVGTGNNAIVTTCTNPTYPTKLSVYEGSCGSLTCITGNAGFCGNGSAVQFCTRLGTSYYISVSGTGTATGAYTLNIVDDAQNPIISNCPSDIVIGLDPDSCEKAITWTPPTITDDCSVPPQLVTSSSSNPGDKFSVGTTIVSYTADDEAGNSAICEFDITVEDNQKPVIGKCLNDIALVADNNCGALLPDFSGIALEVAHSVNDFSGNQGEKGWRYGSFGSTPGDWVNFAELPNFNTIPIDDRWEGTQSFSTPFIDAFGAHPGVDNFDFAVRRWTSNYTGDVRIVGEYNDRNCSSTDGVNIRILLNGSQIFYDPNVTSSLTSYQVDTPIMEGDILDFIVDPRFNTGCDDTYFTAVVFPNYDIQGSDNCPNFTVLQVPASNTVVQDSLDVDIILEDVAGNRDTCEFKVRAIPSTTLSDGGTAQCIVLDGETRNFYDIDGDLILTVEDDPAPGLLSITDVELTIDVSVQTILDSEGDPQPYLQRHWNVSPIIPGPATVRFYFSENEIDDLVNHPASVGKYNMTLGGILSNVCLTKYPNGLGPGGVGGSLIPNSDITFTGPDANGIYSMEFNVTTFSDFYCHPCNRDAPFAALPIELIEFTATAAEHEIQLDWSTALEVENMGFEIQRSTNGESFVQIGWKDGFGNSVEQRDYEFIDEDIINNIQYYYRLKQLDFNGKFEYSPIRSATVISKESIQLSDFIPNPTIEKSRLEIISSTEQQIQLDLYDYMGNKVSSEHINLIRGANIIQLNLEILQSGTYLAVVRTPKEAFSKRLVIAK